jgi:MYXO-CTERM domain-containing protein
MWTSLLLTAALAAQPTLTDTSLAWDGTTLIATVAASSPLPLGKARAELVGHKLQILLPGATLDAPERTFGKETRAPIAAQRRGDAVALEIPIGNRLDCKGPVQLTASGSGIGASLACALKGAAPAGALERSAERQDKLEKAAKADNPSPAEQLRTVVQLTPEPLSEPAPAKGVEVPRAAAPSASGAPSSALPKDLPRSESSASSSSLAWPIFALLALGAAGYLFARQRSRTTHIVSIIETAPLGPKRSLIVARVGSQTLLIGASEAGISLLTTVRRDEALQTAEDALAAGLSTESLAAEFGEHVGDAPALAPLEPEEAERGQASLLSRLLGAKDKGPAMSFESLLEDRAEDRELRHKLEAGLVGRVS